MHPYSLAALGGALIGLSASLVLLGLGRVAGVSGMLFHILATPRAPNGDASEQTVARYFTFGLLIVGALATQVAPGAFGDSPAGLLATSIAGLLVGVGTRMSNGCTSGHGVCGISRGSMRSLLATIVFIVTGALTVAFVKAIS